MISASILLLLLPLAAGQNSLNFAWDSTSSGSSGMGPAFGAASGGFQGPWGGRHGGRRFAWMQSASTEGRNAIQQVFFNRQLNFDQKHAVIEQIVARESPEVQAAYMQSRQEMRAKKAQMRQTHDALAARLSPQARQADAMMSQLFMNRNLPWNDRRQHVRQIMESQPESVRQELAAMRQEMHKNSPWGGTRKAGGRGGWGAGGGGSEWRGRRMFN